MSGAEDPTKAPITAIGRSHSAFQGKGGNSFSEWRQALRLFSPFSEISEHVMLLQIVLTTMDLIDPVSSPLYENQGCACWLIFGFSARW